MGISNKTRLGIIELQTNHKISTVLAGRTTTFLSCYQAIEGDVLIFQQAGPPLFFDSLLAVKKACCTTPYFQFIIAGRRAFCNSFVLLWLNGK